MCNRTNEEEHELSVIGMIISGQTPVLPPTFLSESAKPLSRAAAVVMSSAVIRRHRTHRGDSS